MFYADPDKLCKLKCVNLTISYYVLCYYKNFDCCSNQPEYLETPVERYFRYTQMCIPKIPGCTSKSSCRTFQRKFCMDLPLFPKEFLRDLSKRQLKLKLSLFLFFFGCACHSLCLETCLSCSAVCVMSQTSWCEANNNQEVISSNDSSTSLFRRINAIKSDQISVAFYIWTPQRFFPLPLLSSHRHASKYYYAQPVENGLNGTIHIEIYSAVHLL